MKLEIADSCLSPKSKDIKDNQPKDKNHSNHSDSSHDYVFQTIAKPTLPDESRNVLAPRKVNKSEN